MQQPIPSGAAYHASPVIAYHSANDFLSNFGHALFDFLFPVFNMLQLLGLYNPDMQIVFAKLQVCRSALLCTCTGLPSDVCLCSVHNSGDDATAALHVLLPVQVPAPILHNSAAMQTRIMGKQRVCQLASEDSGMLRCSWKPPPITMFKSPSHLAKDNSWLSDLHSESILDRWRSLTASVCA